jgi:hypothetical protein
LKEGKVAILERTCVKITGDKMIIILKKRECTSVVTDNKRPCVGSRNVGPHGMESERKGTKGIS